MKKSTCFDTHKLVILAMLCGILLLMSFTPLGYLNIGPLAITLNMIPVAIAAVVLGPLGGAVTGGMFGLTSFLQCIGVGGVSAMGAVLFGINPFLAFIQRFIPRLLAGFIAGLVCRWVQKKFNNTVASFLTGFLAAFLNTLLFMSALIILFGNTEYVKGLIGGQNIIVFVCAFVGINALFEMIASTAVVGLIGKVLEKTKLIRRD